MSIHVPIAWSHRFISLKLTVIVEYINIDADSPGPLGNITFGSEVLRETTNASSRSGKESSVIMIFTHCSVSMEAPSEKLRVEDLELKSSLAAKK